MHFRLQLQNAKHGSDYVAHLHFKHFSVVQLEVEVNKSAVTEFTLESQTGMYSPFSILHPQSVGGGR